MQRTWQRAKGEGSTPAHLVVQFELDKPRAAKRSRECRDASAGDQVALEVEGAQVVVLGEDFGPHERSGLAELNVGHLDAHLWVRVCVCVPA